MEALFVALFYSFAAVVLVEELYNLFFTQRQFRFLNWSVAQMKMGPAAAMDYVRKHPWTIRFQLLYTVWCIAGLFTQVWYGFAGILALSLIMGLTGLRRKHPFWLQVDASITVLLVLLILVCRFIKPF